MTEILFARKGEIPSGTNIPGFLNLTNIVTPTIPASGTINIYGDATQKVLTVQDDAGRLTNTVFPSTAGAHQFATAVSANGTITYTQPAFSDISGTATVAQGGTGAITLIAHGVLLGEGTSAIVATAAGTNGQLLLGNTGADAAFATMSGDATITASGTLTIANLAVTSAKLAANAVTNAKLDTMAAWTIKLNNTSGAATPTDVTIDGLTNKASPTTSDEVPIWDAATSTMKKTGIGNFPFVTSFNSRTGAVVPADADYTFAQIGAGVTTISDATAGRVGEQKDATAALQSVSMTTGSTSNITSISLTAGDWEVNGIVYALPAATTVVNYGVASLGTTSATLNQAVGQFASNEFAGAVLTNNAYVSLTIPNTRFNVSSTTTVYLASQWGFTTSTLTCGGSIHARRVR